MPARTTANVTAHSLPPPPVPPLPSLCSYNPRLPLTSQLNIGGPLLSRFDIVVRLWCWKYNMY